MGRRENSMEFVRHVLAAQADVLEVDVRMGKNRELIISHDKTEKKRSDWPKFLNL